MSRVEIVVRLLAAGLFMLATSAFFLRDSVRLLRRGEHGIGVIVAIAEPRRRTGSRRALVRLTGTRISGQCEIAARRDDVVGRSLPMVFLPEQPAICRIDRLPQLIGAPGLTFGLSALVVLGSLAVFERERRKAKR